MEWIIIVFISKEELSRLHKLSFQSEEILREAETIGCFNCIQLIDFSDVEAFIQDEDKLTAVCPNCSVESLIPLSGFKAINHRALLSQMNFQYLGQSIHFKKPNKKRGKSKEIYLYQVQDTDLMDLIQDVDTKLSETNRLIGKNMYPAYNYAIRYLIPFKNEEILLYAIEDQFVNRILPSIYRDIDFPLEKKALLETITEDPYCSNFMIILPNSLSRKDAESVIKLLGTVFGGYFAKLSDVPSTGILNKDYHIFVDEYQGYEDIINELEYFLRAYS